MANVIHPTTLQFIQGVNAANYPSPWVADPDMSQVVGVAHHYWKWDAGTTRPISMTAGEKSAVDAQELADISAAKATGFDTAAPAGVSRFVLKKSDETRTATTTLVDDAALIFPVVAGANYIFHFRVFFDTTAAGDFKCTLHGPASPTGVRFDRRSIAPGATVYGVVGVSTAWDGVMAVTGTGTTGGYVEGFGVLRNGVNAGNVSFQWAQNTSDAGNTVVRAGSCLEWARID